MVVDYLYHQKVDFHRVLDFKNHLTNWLSWRYDLYSIVLKNLKIWSRSSFCILFFFTYITIVFFFSLCLYLCFYFSQLNELLIWLNESRGRAKLKERLRIIDPSALYFQRISWFQILIIRRIRKRLCKGMNSNLYRSLTAFDSDFIYLFIANWWLEIRDVYQSQIGIF